MREGGEEGEWRKRERERERERENRGGTRNSKGARKMDEGSGTNERGLERKAISKEVTDGEKDRTRDRGLERAGGTGHHRIIASASFSAHFSEFFA